MPLDYGTLRGVHVLAAVLSIALFVWRGTALVRTPAAPRAPWLRIAPHVVDTILLASALALAWQLGAAGTRGWLAPKVVAVVLYVVLGTIALRRGRTTRVRTVSFVLALFTFAYIVGVAITKSPYAFLPPQH